jgi:hypothetical protein
MNINYKNLLDIAHSEYDAFSLVWRHEFRFLSSAKKISDILEPYLLSEEVTDNWPGTKLIGGLAVMRKYRVSNESIEILSVVNEIHEWLAPKYPEDLAFYKGEKLMFASISHEHEAWFEKD